MMTRIFNFLRGLALVTVFLSFLSFLRRLSRRHSSSNFRMISVSSQNCKTFNSLLEDALISPANSSFPEDINPAQKDYDRTLIRFFSKKERPKKFQDFLSLVTSDQDFTSKHLRSSPQGLGNMFLRPLLQGDFIEPDGYIYDFSPANNIMQTAYQKLNKDGISLCSSLCSFSYIQGAHGDDAKVLANKYNRKTGEFELIEVDKDVLNGFMRTFHSWYQERSDFVTFGDIEKFCRDLTDDKSNKDIFMPVSSACVDLSYSKRNKPSKVVVNDLKIIIPMSQGAFNNFKPILSSRASLKKILYDVVGLKEPSSLSSISFSNRSANLSQFSSICDLMRANIERRPYFRNRLKRIPSPPNSSEKVDSAAPHRRRNLHTPQCTKQIKKEKGGAQPCKRGRRRR